MNPTTLATLDAEQGVAPDIALITSLATSNGDR